MNIEALGQSDACVITPDIHKDSRGFFFRTFCVETLQAHGIEFHAIQGNTSLTRLRHSVRGMHFQRAPKADAKLVRCTAGSIYDVIVDLREESPARGSIYSTVLSAEQPQTLYIPGGYAHGFQTLSDDCVVEYVMGEAYDPALYDGVRHDDPDLTISWPHAIAAISDSDQRWPDLYPRMPWIRRPAHHDRVAGSVTI